MSKLLQTLIAYPLPSVDDMVEQQVEQARAAFSQRQLENLQSKVSQTPPADEPLAEIKVMLTKTNDCNMSIAWKNVPDKSNAKAVARMLYQLNEGAMKALMAEIITQTSQNDYRMTESGQNIMEAWEKMYHQDASEPCVSPSQVFPNG